LLTLPPYGFYWFALETASDQPTWHTPAPEPLPEFVTLVARDLLAKAIVTPAATLVEDEALPQYMVKRRWFGFKDQTIKSARIANVADLSDIAREMVLSEIEIRTGGASLALVAAPGHPLGRRAVECPAQPTGAGARAARPPPRPHGCVRVAGFWAPRGRCDCRR
jgi:hypothetical protein